jgi:hypothetical protein
MKTKTKAKRKSAPVKDSQGDFYRIQGQTLGFFKWVLRRQSSTDAEIYLAFLDLMEVHSDDREDTATNLFIAHLNFALRDEVINNYDLNRLMMALLNEDEEDRWYSWLAHCIAVMNESKGRK